jgi:hypothetical protein
MIHEDSQPLRELQWLYNYFKAHGHDHKAKEIYDQIRMARKVAQNSLNQSDASEVLLFGSGARDEEGSDEIG